MKIFIKGKKQEVNLNQKNFVMSGGEGEIYAKNNIAYKIYFDKNKVIPEAKVLELSNLTLQNIIKPENILIDKSSKNVGYSMQYVTNTVALCQLFPKAFKVRENITQEKIIKLIKQFRDGIEHCHNNNVLLVDINEMNFLVNKDKYNIIYFIDCDSYQTKSYKATAIMDNIRDRHNDKFSKLTDWFSFGIITFQLITGIHPYRGNHKRYGNDLDSRMINNISIFNKEVKFPPVFNNFQSLLPQSYLDWYKSEFEDGTRLPFPLDATAVIVVQQQIQKIVSMQFDVKEYFECDGNVIKYSYVDGWQIILTDKKLYAGATNYQDIASYAHICMTPKYSKIISAIVKHKELKLRNIINQKDLQTSIKASDLFSIENRLYILSNDREKIYEIIFTEMSEQNIIVSLHLVCNTLASSVQVFNGVVIQNLLSSYFINLFPESKKCISYNIKELVGYRIIDAKYMNRILMVIAEKKGKYDKFVFKLDLNNTLRYDVRKFEDTKDNDINFCVLDNGICCHVIDDSNMELFHNDINSKDSKLIKDNILYKANIFHKGNDLLFFRDNKLFKIKSK